jgi:hypothetical protein
LFSSDPDGELLVELLRQEWHDVRDRLIVVLEVRVTNQVVWEKTIRGFMWQGQFLDATGEPAIRESVEALLRGRQRIAAPRDAVIAPKRAIQGWAAEAFRRSDNPDIVSPAYTFTVKDELQHNYRLDVPQRGRVGLLQLGPRDSLKAETE